MANSAPVARRGMPTPINQHQTPFLRFSPLRLAEPSSYSAFAPLIYGNNVGENAGGTRSFPI